MCLRKNCRTLRFFVNVEGCARGFSSVIQVRPLNLKGKKMKHVLLALTIGFSGFAAHAADQGLNCTMKYRNSSPLAARDAVTQAWLADGDTLKSEVLTPDENMEVTRVPANFLEVSTYSVSGNKLWNVEIQNGKKQAVGSFSFPYQEGMKVVIPASAIEDESEDPATYDVLEVTCHFTHFAG